MKILVDADALPVLIKDILIRTADKRKIPMIFIANQKINIPRSEYATFLSVSDGFNIADDRIVELTEENDLIVTADIPLADRAIEKKAFAINPRGTLYTIENIKQTLAVRNLMADLRSDGQINGGPAPFTKKDSHAFANQLDRFLTSHLKKLSL